MPERDTDTPPSGEHAPTLDPSYWAETPYGDDGYDRIDYLIDNDPIDLGNMFRWSLIELSKWRSVADALAECAGAWGSGTCCNALAAYNAAKEA